MFTLMWVREPSAFAPQKPNQRELCNFCFDESRNYGESVVTRSRERVARWVAGRGAMRSFSCSISGVIVVVIMEMSSLAVNHFLCQNHPRLPGDELLSDLAESRSRLGSFANRIQRNTKYANRNHAG